MTPEGVLVTGAFGSGKSSVIAEMAERFEALDLPYGLIDLDYLMWFDAPVDDQTHDAVFLSNVQAVVRNYVDAGVDRFVMALAVSDRGTLEALRQTLPVSLKVIRLVTPLSAIEARLAADVTTGRRADLREAARWVTESIGEGLEDHAVRNDRPIEHTVSAILEWLDWPGLGRVK